MAQFSEQYDVANDIYEICASYQEQGKSKAEIILALAKCLESISDNHLYEQQNGDK